MRKTHTGEVKLVYLLASIKCLVPFGEGKCQQLIFWIHSEDKLMTAHGLLQDDTCPCPPGTIRCHICWVLGDRRSFLTCT